MNYWYVARANELFIDTDNVSKSIKHTKARLQGAIECGKLDVAYILSNESSPGHSHTIITINTYLTDVERFAWEIIFHGDIYRGCCNLMRWGIGCNAPDIIISQYAKFVERKGIHKRLADDRCDCPRKHKAKIMLTCPAAIRLRGENRTRGFFGKPSKNPCTIWPDL